MFVAILINIIIVLVAIFVPALVRAVKLNESGRRCVENINESLRGYSDIGGERPSYSKDIDKILSSAGVDNFSIDDFFENLKNNFS